jgi:iron(III) transport system ATP-binding protein
MTALVVTGLTRSFGAQRVLDGVDLTLESGVTAILGPSGCGKTTLLRLVAGFLEPEAGTIRIGGREVAGPGRSAPPRERRVGYVPQEGALFPHLDVAANIGFGVPRGAGRAARSARVTEMLDLVELPRALARRYPHEISGGQQQRVAVARALAPEPGLVLLDEPFSSLDAGLREDTGRAVVRAVRSGGAAALLVTHDQGEALSLADQVAVMAGGRFLQVASPSELYVAPADERVASFVGHATLLPGQADGGSAVCELGRVALVDASLSGPVMLVLRPEQVVVAAPGAGGTQGRVLDVSFFGHDATVRAAVTGSEAVVTARTPAGAVPASGDEVCLGVVGAVTAFAKGGDDDR